jgi:hypothetical protein
MEVVMPSKRRLLGGTFAAVAAPAVLARRAFAEEKGVGKNLKEVVTGKKDEEVTPPRT